MDDRDEGLRDIKRALIRTMVGIIVESSLVPIDDEDREVIVQYKMDELTAEEFKMIVASKAELLGSQQNSARPLS